MTESTTQVMPVEKVTIEERMEEGHGNKVDGEIVEAAIYHLYRPSQRRLMLIAAACISFLTPFTDTVYLPALTSVASTFNASDTSVALTVSIYLACVGVGQLFWGPLSDHYGRTMVLYIVLIIYEALTIGCIFANSIITLIVLRSLQGLVVGSTIVSAQALIADVFPNDELGEAMGAFMAPMLLGPIVAPIVGGFLSQAFGWRSTFVLLTIMVVPIFILTVIAVPETHHWFVVQKLEKSNQNKQGAVNLQYSQLESKETIEEIPSATEITDKDTKEDNLAMTTVDLSAEPSRPTISTEETVDSPSRAGNSTSGRLYQPEFAERIYHLTVKNEAVILIENKDLIHRPPLVSPWEVFQFALDKDLAPFYVIQCLSFSLMFTCLTISPLKLSIAPYNLSEGIIGLTYLPIGVAMLLGSILGGNISDKTVARYPHIPEARLLYSSLPKIIIIAGGIIFGYTLEAGINLAVILISQFLIGFGQAVIMTMVLSYLSSARPKSAAGVAAVMMFLCFAAAAVFVSIAVQVSEAIGLGNFFLLLSGLLAIGCIGSFYVLFQKFTWREIFFFQFSSNEKVKEVKPSSSDIEL